MQENPIARGLAIYSFLHYPNRNDAPISPSGALSVLRSPKRVRIGRTDPLTSCDNAAQSVAEAIMMNGGRSEDVRVWNKTYMDLSAFCEIEKGPTDEFTRTMIICWCCWILGANSATTDFIYDSVHGFNFIVRDDEAGERGTERIYEAIEKHTSDPAAFYREYANEYLNRLRKKARLENNQRALALRSDSATSTDIVKVKCDPCELDAKRPESR